MGFARWYVKLKMDQMCFFVSFHSWSYQPCCFFGFKKSRNIGHTLNVLLPLLVTILTINLTCWDPLSANQLTLEDNAAEYGISHWGLSGQNRCTRCGSWNRLRPGATIVWWFTYFTVPLDNSFGIGTSYRWKNGDGYNVSCN
jgi:hypothetical protein